MEPRLDQAGLIYKNKQQYFCFLSSSCTDPSQWCFIFILQNHFFLFYVYTYNSCSLAVRANSSAEETHSRGRGFGFLLSIIIHNFSAGDILLWWKKIPICGSHVCIMQNITLACHLMSVSNVVNSCVMLINFHLELDGIIFFNWLYFVSTEIYYYVNYSRQR